jgi:hypothetical protein
LTVVGKVPRTEREKMNLNEVSSRKLIELLREMNWEPSGSEGWRKFDTQLAVLREVLPEGGHAEVRNASHVGYVVISDSEGERHHTALGRDYVASTREFRGGTEIDTRSLDLPGERAWMITFPGYSQTGFMGRAAV